MYIMKRELLIGMVVILVFDAVMIFGIAKIFMGQKNGQQVTGAVVGGDKLESNDIEVQVEESNLSKEITGTFVITNSSIDFLPDQKKKG